MSDTASLILPATIRDAIALIEASRKFLAVILDSEEQILGVVSDGDVRRGILAGQKLDNSVETIMNRHPLTGNATWSDQDVMQYLHEKAVAAIPLVDDAGQFVRIAQVTDDGDGDIARETAGGQIPAFWGAVLMAGGEGRRLRPLTHNQPKPMIEIGGVPLLERQIRRLVTLGITRIYISINYLAHIIEDHFGDGSDFGARITYLRETSKLGTAGALSLIDEKPAGPLLVMNGDVLTTSDYSRLLDFHADNDGALTVAAVEYHVEIPFGVIRFEGVEVSALEEKPSQQFLCNAGIYIIEPDMLDHVPADTFINMTDVIEQAMAAGQKVVVYPLHEYWTDIGNPDDLEKARAKFID